MVMDLTDAKAVFVVLAIIGVVALLAAASMLFMHSSIMGGFQVHGLLSSMANMCRGMMGI